MDYSQTVTEHLRIAVLRLLEEQNDGRMNDSLLSDMCRPLGFDESRDRIRTEIAWLEEQRLVKVEQVGPLMVAEITERGADAAHGRITVPGVRKPSRRSA